MNIAVFYHCKISGDGIPDESYGLEVLAEQMGALRDSGLASAAQEIHIGVNGDDAHSLIVAALCPAKSRLYPHGNHAKSEIPTMDVIRRWLPGHERWAVLYHHTKGVTHVRDPFYARWRERMAHACVWNWQYCVGVIERGYEACGCHWLTPERFPGAVTSPFFGGTFWWASSEYLKQLPALPAATWENRFEAESWIGRRRPYPLVMDFLPGWP